MTGTGTDGPPEQTTNRQNEAQDDTPLMKTSVDLDSPTKGKPLAAQAAATAAQQEANPNQGKLNKQQSVSAHTYNLLYSSSSINALLAHICLCFCDPSLVILPNG